MKNVTFLDHTADTGILVRADSLEALFSTSAGAMFHIICPRKNHNKTINHSISITAPDIEQLLVDWLSELNFLFQTKQFLLSDIPKIKIDYLSLWAQVSGERVDFGVHDIHVEIKAVTYHKLYVRKINHHWGAQIIFDI
ncbi:archease [candidate division KSB1 bacterium]|nr:archease [candidate division KSB1 bacterium]